MNEATGKMDQSFDVPLHVVARELDGDMVLLDIESGLYFSLNKVGARLWSHLLDGATLATARDGMLNEFDVEAAVLEADILGLVNQLQDAKLIEARR